MLKDLLKIDKLISNSLKDWISTPLADYINYLKKSELLKIKFQQDTLILEQFARNCQLLDDVFDYYNKDQIFNFFKNKQPHNIERYVKVLTGLVSKAIQENKSINKKYIKQVFGGESQTFLKLLKDNLSWLLEKFKYEFSEEQVLKILTMVFEYHELFVKPNNPQLKVKLDAQLQQFLAEQSLRFPELSLQEKYSTTFFSTDDQLQDKEIIIKQVALSKEKAQAANNKQKAMNDAILNGDYPENIKEFFDSMIEKFDKASTAEYKKLDKEIGDVLHQVYKDRLGDTSQLSSEIFKVLDQDLGTKKTINEAKNCKKLLAAIQKSKILHPTETTTLFAKANKFMSKENVKKEMTKIKKEVKEKVLLEGPAKTEEQPTDKTDKPQSQEKREPANIDQPKPAVQTEAISKLDKYRQ